MNTKEIEHLGMEALVGYLQRSFGSDRVKIDDIRKDRNYGCDAIMTIDDKRHFVEIKASMKKELPTNIRFTHQTVATMHNADELDQMIVAFIYNLKEGIENAMFAFFRFGDIDPKNVEVEPHFIIKPRGANEQLVKDELSELLDMDPRHRDPSEQSISAIFETKVREHMKLNTMTPVVDDVRE